MRRDRDKAWHWVFKFHCLLKYLCFLNRMWPSDHCFHLLFYIGPITDFSLCLASAKLLWGTEECQAYYHLGATQGLRNINHTLNITSASAGKTSLREAEMGMRDHAAVPRTPSVASKSYCGGGVLSLWVNKVGGKGWALEWWLAVKASPSFHELTQEGMAVGGFLLQLHIWASSCGGKWKGKTNPEEKLSNL